MKLIRTRATVLALTVLLAACAGHTPPGTVGFAADEPTLVRVTNNNWSDMVIYVLNGRASTRLGRVPSLSTVELEVPRSLVLLAGDLQIAADPVGNEPAFRTGPIHVEPGQRVEFTVQNHLEVSYFTVWDL